MPEIPGYQFDQRLLEHPLAEIWRGRSFTGMDIVALILSEAGAADHQVRERLGRASRGAALEPGRQESPLWAANFSTPRPYAITQLVPGQSGAERLIDPLDGVVGNNEESLRAARGQLAPYGAVPPPQADLPWQVEEDVTAAGQPVKKIEVARQYGRKMGRWVYLVIVLGVLVVFSVTYSVGAAIGSAVKDPQTQSQGPAPAPVSPGPLPTPGVLPAIAKVKAVPYQPTVPTTSLVGATYQRGADVRVVEGAGLPFEFAYPQPPYVRDLGESSSAMYRRVLTSDDLALSKLDTEIAVHPCRDLAGCLADRAAFDQQWTTLFEAPAPTTAKNAQTWLTVQSEAPYTVTMTHAFSSGGRWWLVGAAVSGPRGQETAVQQVLNDIWWQTQ